MTLDREVSSLSGNDKNLGSIKDHLGNLEEANMDILFFIYFSKSFGNLWRGECNVIFLLVY